ncbi:MAG: 26S proteasome non-ATPase regulatory subunit 3 [Paramarteilia canceri]
MSQAAEAITVDTENPDSSFVALVQSTLDSLSTESVRRSRQFSKIDLNKKFGLVICTLRKAKVTSSLPKLLCEVLKNSKLRLADNEINSELKVRLDELDDNESFVLLDNLGTMFLLLLLAWLYLEHDTETSLELVWSIVNHLKYDELQSDSHALQIAHSAFVIVLHASPKTGNLKTKWQSFLLKNLAAVQRRVDLIQIQAIVLLILLKNFVAQRNIKSASQLITKSNIFVNILNSGSTDFLKISSLVSSRLHYYFGYIIAIQGDYFTAREHLDEASRLSQTNKSFKNGFNQSLNKLVITVRLLDDFSKYEAIKGITSLSKNSIYLSLAENVQNGSYADYVKTLEAGKNIFARDGTLSLAKRLSKNVRMRMLVNIVKAYSKIKLEEVAKKLQLDNFSDVHFIIQQAILNNVINAHIINDGTILESLFYKSKSQNNPHENSLKLQERIEFILKLYEQMKSSLYCQNLSNSRKNDLSDSSDENDKNLNDKASAIEIDLLNNLSDMTDDF